MTTSDKSITAESLDTYILQQLEPTFKRIEAQSPLFHQSVLYQPAWDALKEYVTGLGCLFQTQYFDALEEEDGSESPDDLLERDGDGLPTNRTLEQLTRNYEFQVMDMEDVRTYCVEIAKLAEHYHKKTKFRTSLDAALAGRTGDGSDEIAAYLKTELREMLSNANVYESLDVVRNAKDTMRKRK